MPRYRVTLESDFIDRNDAQHWAMWVAGFESIARSVDVISVVRMGPSEVASKAAGYSPEDRRE